MTIHKSDSSGIEEGPRVWPRRMMRRTVGLVERRAVRLVRQLVMRPLRPRLIRPLSQGLMRSVRRGVDRRVMMVAPALLLLALTGCDLVPLRGNADALGTNSGVEGLSIAEDEVVGLESGGPLLSFEEVTNDSRCPSDVQCPWAGEAGAAFRLTGSEGDTTFVLTIPGLTSTPYEQNEALAVLGFEFKLLELRPYPRLERDDPPDSYRAVLHIEKLEK